MHDVFARARASPQRILLNEPGDPRVLAAAAALAERGLCVPVLLGSRPAIAAFAGELAGTLLQREKEASNNGRNNSNGKSRRKKSSSSDSEEEDVEALPADRRFLRGLEKCEIIDPLRAEEVGELTARYADELARARAHKGMTLAAARELLRPEEHGRRVPNASIHFATMMLRSGDAGGLLSGAAHTTLETVRPALQLLTRRPHGERGGEEEDGGGGAKMKKSGAGGAAGAGEAAVAEAAPPGLVSSLFFMCLPRGVVAFADCALNVSPTPAELARIALDSASTARAFGLSPPRVALLSYSTRGSGRGAGPAAAAEAARRAAPEGVFVDGPLQYDAAVSPSVGKERRERERKKEFVFSCFFSFHSSSPTTTTTTTKHHHQQQQNSRPETRRRQQQRRRPQLPLLRRRREGQRPRLPRPERRKHRLQSRAAGDRRGRRRARPAGALRARQRPEPRGERGRRRVHRGGDGGAGDRRGGGEGEGERREREGGGGESVSVSERASERERARGFTTSLFSFLSSRAVFLFFFFHLIVK